MASRSILIVMRFILGVLYVVIGIPLAYYSMREFLFGGVDFETAPSAGARDWVILIFYSAIGTSLVLYGFFEIKLFSIFSSKDTETNLQTTNGAKEFYLVVKWKNRKPSRLEIHGVRSLDDKIRQLSLKEAIDSLAQHESLRLGPYQIEKYSMITKTVKEFSLDVEFEMFN